MIAFRVKTLLEPIGVPASYIVPEKEANDVLIGAYDGEELIGCCILTGLDKELVQLRQMAVQKDRQGQHIGAAIISFAEQAARELGYSRLMMHARDPVIGFYEKCGYSIKGEQFFEVGLGHHRMEKKL